MQERIDAIIDVLDRNKAKDIEIFNLKEKDYIVDYAVIATSLGQKHTPALLDYLKLDLKPRGETFAQVDDESDDWIVIDLGDIMIHIMTEKYREKYHLDEFMEEIKERKINS